MTYQRFESSFLQGYYKNYEDMKLNRSTLQRCSVRKGALTNFANFTGKHLRLRPATLLKKRLWHWGFPVNFCEISKNIFFAEHLRASASKLNRL